MMRWAGRWMTTLATAGLAELAAHWLSLGWGFMVVVGAFVFVAVHVTAGMTAATSKVMATEARLSNHIVATAPAVSLQASGGTIGGNTTITGGATITGQALINGGSGAAALEVGGSTHITGNLQVDGNMNGGAVVVGGQTVSGWPLSGSTPITSGGATISTGFANALNSMYNSLVNSGLI